MQRDLRDTPLYQEVESLYSTIRKPGSGLITDVAEVSTNGRQAAFSGTMIQELKGTPPTRVCLTDLETGDTRVVTFGPNTDRSPKFSPDGKQIAFLSDRAKAGDFQLYLLDPEEGGARPAPQVEGWVEYLHWSPDGKRILLGVAGHGADVAGGQGAVKSKTAEENLPSWMPIVETGDESFRWRHVWIYEVATETIRAAGPKDLNVWEAVWCGNDAIACVSSLGPGEGLWYDAKLRVVEIGSGKSREVYTPKDQLGWPAASPSGKRLSIVEAVCSDRWIVAGELKLVDRASGKAKPVDTNGVDVTHCEWRSENQLLVAGHRDFETVVGLYDAAKDSFTQTWASDETTIGGRYATASGIGESGDCVILAESFLRAPEVALIQKKKYRVVRSFDAGFTDAVKSLPVAEQVRWKAGDGLEIHGWLLRPSAKGTQPLVMNVHGGPVWHWRPNWLGRSSPLALILLKHGYAVLFPNPRGSSGRGQEYARHVVGDMGGGDAKDLLAGLDALVERRIADPKRLGVMGGSYGGFMSSWLVTQDTRFAAAAPFSPVTNQVTEHLIGNIPHFVAMFCNDRFDNPGGAYFQQSPIMFAKNVRTPTLNICGALDRCTPPEEAVQFHNALLENDVESVLVTYPEEGHGVRKLPTIFDFAARTVSWFEQHMPARGAGGGKPGKSAKAKAKAHA